jgi:DnaJ-class molecular chaperone
VKAAYKKLSLQLHPDKNPDCKDCAAKFSKVAKAYRSLTHVGHKTEKVPAFSSTRDVGVMT